MDTPRIKYIAWSKARKAAMQKLHAKKWSITRIAEKYGVTRQRVQQILSRP